MALILERWAHLFTSLMICMVLIGCRGEGQAPQATVLSRSAVATVNIAPADIQVYSGQSLILTATLADASGNILASKKLGASFADGSDAKQMTVVSDSRGRGGRVLKWSSDQPDLLTVDMQGRLTAHNPGVARISVESEGVSDTVVVTVLAHDGKSLSLSPTAGTMSVGERLQLFFSAGVSLTSLVWNSESPEIITVDRNGVTTALASGEAQVSACQGGRCAVAVLNVKPTEMIRGLDFPGNAGVKQTIRFEFTQPPAAVPVTYIWRAYPRQQESYYTAFFWGNNGAFHPNNTYFGFHPYPDWDTASQQLWEIAAAPGSDIVSAEHVVFDRWYTQVAVCGRDDDRIGCEFYWDWPETTKVIRYSKESFVDPPDPVLVVGDAPWNQGNEVWNGVLRGFQFYDTVLTLEEVAQEIKSPGSARIPWYLNLNPTTADISDKGGRNHHPEWVGNERPLDWQGLYQDKKIIRKNVPCFTQ